MDLSNFVKCLNHNLNAKLKEALKSYYHKNECAWMRSELELIDPLTLHGASGAMLKQHGVSDLKKLLSHYGRNKTVGVKEFKAPIDGKNCMKEYNDWKQFAVLITHKVIELPTRYEQIMSLYQKTYVKYRLQYPNWFRLYERILLNWGSSMSLERMFRTRKLLQPAERSNFGYKGLGNRMVLCYNSAEPGSMESVILYIRAIRKWNEMRQSRLYAATSPLDDVRLCDHH